MPFENVQTITLDVQAAAAVTQRRFVIQTATGVTQATAGAMAVGVSMGDVAAEDESRALAVAANVGGRFEVEASGAITKGANIAADAAGKAKIATTGEIILGVADTAVAADGEYVEFVFNPQGAAAA